MDKLPKDFASTKDTYYAALKLDRKIKILNDLFQDNVDSPILVFILSRLNRFS